MLLMSLIIAIDASELFAFIVGVALVGVVQIQRVTESSCSQWDKISHPTVND